MFSDCFHGKRLPWELKRIKRGITPIFIVNKRLREAKVKFLIEHGKKEFKYCIITLYIEETPDMNISDTSNEQKQVLAHNCFYISGKAKTYVKFHTHLDACWDSFHFPKPLVNPLTVTLIFFQTMHLG